MELHIETIPPERIAYVRQTGPYGPANALAMEQLKAWAKKKGLLTDSAVILGIPAALQPLRQPDSNQKRAAAFLLAEGHLPFHTVGITGRRAHPWLSPPPGSARRCPAR